MAYCGFSEPVHQERDLPERYGAWETVAGRFYRWRQSGLWQRILQALQQQADAHSKVDWEVHYVDGSVIRAHQNAAGAKRGYNETQQSWTALDNTTIENDRQISEGRLSNFVQFFPRGS